MSSFALILPAAGRSARFGGGRNKLFELLDGLPVVVRSLRAFLARADLAAAVIPTSDIDSLAELLHQHEKPLDPRVQLCLGGATRAHSVLNALRQVPSEVEWVAVHDAARPLISQGLIDRTLQAAAEHGAAVPALPVHLTIKQARGPLPAQVMRTVPRHELFAMQTPQIMRRTDLLAAYESCPLTLDQVTDDVQLLELSQKPVWLVQGEENNLKITTAMDMGIAHLLMNPKS